MNLTVDDVSRLFNVSEKTIYRWIKSGGLPAYRVFNQYRFNQTELLEWASTHQVNVVPHAVNPDAKQETGADGAAHDSIAEALDAGGVFYRVAGGDKTAVLGEVVKLFRLPEGIDRKLLLDVLLAREAMGSTSIGEGIAIPHPRNPIVLNVQRPSATLCFLEKPVDFDALDGRPVFALITLISPTVPAHLKLLSRLMFILRQPVFKDMLARPGSREEILAAVHAIEASLHQTAAPSKES